MKCVVAVICLCTLKNVYAIDEDFLRSADFYCSKENSHCPLSRSFNFPDVLLVNESLGLLKENGCKRDLSILIEGIASYKIWAMTMFDASVKFPIGVLKGNVYQLGNFDECTGVRTEFGFAGKYCLGEVNLHGDSQNDKSMRWKSNQTIHWAFCAPSTCRHDELQLLLDGLIKTLLNTSSAYAKIAPENCHVHKEIPVSNLEIIYWSSIGIFMCLVLLATLYHGVHDYRKAHCTQYSLTKYESTSHNVFVGFSLIFNIKKLATIKTKKNYENDIDCICGMRVISMFLILAGHSALYIICSPMMNSEITKPENLGRIVYSLFLNNPLLVDTFLLMSGLLLCKVLLVELKQRQGKINILLLYLARYIRLTPAYAVVLGFYCTSFYRLSDGPFWDQKIALERDRCLKSWWANLLYVNNYVRTDNLCMFQSWYLAVDTQLFLLGPILVYPLWRKKGFGVFLLVCCLVGTGIVPFVCTYLWNLDPTLLFYVPEIRDLATNSYFINAYITTHMRANAYILGIIFGFAIEEIVTSGKKISCFVQTLGWILACIGGFGALALITIFYNPDYVYNNFEAALYNSAHRMVWCSAVGWVVLMCATKNASSVNAILTWSPFRVLSRLTYCSYLVNGFVELYSFSTIRTSTVYYHYNMGLQMIGHITLTVILASILCVLFESPIHNLEKMLLQKANQKRISNDSNELQR